MAGVTTQAVQPDKDAVYFSRAQYEYLNKVFSEQYGKPKEHHEYAFNDGKRTVVNFIRDRVRG